jgi:hypothetical protein
MSLPVPFEYCAISRRKKLTPNVAESQSFTPKPLAVAANFDKRNWHFSDVTFVPGDVRLLGAGHDFGGAPKSWK